MLPGMKIGLISDTHSYLDENVFRHFEQCDEVWHAGDIGSMEIAEQLEAFKPLVAVFGNIDDKPIQLKYPENEHLEREGMKIWMTHIGGSPPRYNPQVRPILKREAPDIFVCGHSHILKVISDQKMGNMLYLNPGAAGRQGFHRIRTILRFEINVGRVENMQVIELGKRGV